MNKYRSLTIGADRVFFTSDTHFWHVNAARFRGYLDSNGDPDVEAMNNDIIARINAKVPAHATLVMLGDISFAGTTRTVDVLNDIKCRKVLVRGNHDKAMNGHVLLCFNEVHDLLNVKVQLPGTDDPQRIVCCHFPMLAWDMQHYGAWHLHGHSHGSCRYPEPRPRILDVGVDPNQFTPLSFWEVSKKIGHSPIVTPDYHQPKT